MRKPNWNAKKWKTRSNSK